MNDRVLGLPRTLWLASAIVIGLVIAVVSVLPPRGTPGIEIASLGEVRAWVLHALGYAILAATAMLAQRAPRPVLTALAIVGYGIVLEAVQGAIGIRSAQVADALANALGALAGAALAWGVGARSRSTGPAPSAR